MEKRALPPFTSEMTKRERVMALAYIPVHAVLLPLGFSWLSVYAGLIDEVTANVLCYSIGFIYMLIFEFRFLRRDFDPLCDHPLHCALEIIAGYLLMMVCNYCTSLILLAGAARRLEPEQQRRYNGHGKDRHALDQGDDDLPRAAGGGADVPRRYIRTLLPQPLRGLRCQRAGVSLYHVWSFAITDPINWIYIIQVHPGVRKRARCYERTNSIWSSIFFHMTVNAVSLQALSMLQGSAMSGYTLKTIARIRSDFPTKPASLGRPG